jgi:hypothetical protein
VSSKREHGLSTTVLKPVAPRLARTSRPARSRFARREAVLRTASRCLPWMMSSSAYPDFCALTNAGGSAASRNALLRSTWTTGAAKLGIARLSASGQALAPSGDCESAGHETETRHARSARHALPLQRARPGEAWPRGCSASGAATGLRATMATARPGEAGTVSLPLASGETGAPSRSSPLSSSRGHASEESRGCARPRAGQERPV